MTDDGETLEARRLRQEAAEANAAAEKKLAEADYKLGQAEHRLRMVEAIERGIAEREQRLLQLGEPQLVARARELDDKQKRIEELTALYDKDRHAALRVLTRHRTRALWPTTTTTPQ
jgi:hypothetical protein